MPFELGVEFGCRLFGPTRLRKKKSLVLRLVRNWLKAVCLPTAPGASSIEAAFTQFMAEDYDALKLIGFSDADIEALPIGELLSRMREWVKISHAKR
jgi:hypothetical protein